MLGNKLDSKDLGLIPQNHMVPCPIPHLWLIGKGESTPSAISDNCHRDANGKIE